MPVDFPLETLDSLLETLAETHQRTTPTPILQSVTDEGVEVSLLGVTAGPMYLQIFLRIRRGGVDQGIPLEAELDNESGRIPLYRPEYPFWPEAEGVASLLAPLPRTTQPVSLRVRHVRLFKPGPGSRSLKVRALAVRPRQAPPVKLSPGVEERYRHSLATPPPAETHQDVYGYWDFSFRPPAAPDVVGVPCQGTLQLPGQASLRLEVSGPRRLSGRADLDWAAAYAAPPVWDGLCTIETLSGEVGVGGFQPDGRITFLFAETVPAQAVITALHLYRVPVSPPLSATATVCSVLPLVDEVQSRLALRDLTVMHVLLGRGGEKSVVPILHAWVEAKVGDVPGRVRPSFRFWSLPDASDRFDSLGSLKSPPGELFAPLPPDFRPPTAWDAPWVDFIVPQNAPITVQSGGPEVSLPLPWVAPTLYSTSPLRMA